MKSFEELMNAWDQVQLEKLTRMSVIVENAIDLAFRKRCYQIFYVQLLTQDCIGRGKDN